MNRGLDMRRRSADVPSPPRSCGAEQGRSLPLALRPALLLGRAGDGDRRGKAAKRPTWRAGRCDPALVARMGRCLVAVLLAVATLVRPAKAETNEQSLLLREAVDEYQAALDCTDRGERLQRFRRAEMLFDQVAGRSSRGDDASSMVQNADLYVNLGNAALGAERLGPAIAA